MKHRLVTGIVTALLACPHTLLATDNQAAAQSQLTLDQLRTFTDVFNQVRSHFVEEVDEVTLLNAAIRGMVTELDPFSVLLDAGEFKALYDTSVGRYGGIGIDVAIEERRIVVTRVYEDGPAARAGMRAGDLITAINGLPVKGRLLHEAAEDFVGEPGSELTVEVKTAGMPSRDVSLTRSYIPVRSVASNMMDGAIGYFRITHFHEDSHTDLEKAIAELRRKSEAPLKGIILDLRDNLGGVIQPAVAVADGFLEDGLIVYTRGRYEATQLEFRAGPGEWLPGMPLAVLVNHRTASASEVLAGALQDHGRAVIIGEATFGKGSIQSLLALRDGSALRLTTARYFTPLGKSIHGTGIQPDIVVRDSDTQDQALTEALEHLKKNTAG
jgi:carboxyl-terminal processing protease